MNPITRMAQLAPREAGLQLRHYIASADRIWLERFLHEAYSHRRVRLEWFRLSAGDVEDFCTINEADDLDQLPSWVVAKRVLNEPSGFAWGEQDDKVLVPMREVCPRIAFHLDQELYDAVMSHCRISVVEVAISAVLRLAVRQYLESVGEWPPAAPNK